MKKRALLLSTILSMIFTLQLTAQDESIEKKALKFNHELGLNATSLLKQVISLSDTTIATSPYLITYKLMVNETVGLRAGFGGKYKRSEETVDDFEDSQTTTNSAFDWRLGVEYQRQLGRKWKASLGADFIKSSSLNKIVIDTGFDVVTFDKKASAVGGGPVIGVSFMINDKISLYTEGAAYFTSGTSSESQDFKNFPEFNDKSNDITETTFDFHLPTTIWFVLTF